MRPDEVQIYESILGDSRENPTTGLLTATQYLKDNRLLPRGFDKTTASPDIAVFGEAAQDDDFAGGGERVRFVVPVEGAGPYLVEVELRYQTISYRWAENLSTYDAPERFLSYFRSMSQASSVVVASAASESEGSPASAF